MNHITNYNANRLLPASLRLRHAKAALIGLCSLLLVGCSASTPAVNARMTDDEIRAALAAHVPAGASQAQVEAGLDQMNVSKKWRVHYAAKESRPPVLLARLYEPGGPWIDHTDDDIEFVDVSFVFEPADRLSKTLLFRDRIRYFGGDPITSPNSPKRVLMKAPERYPLPIAPPVDPLEGAK